MVKDYNCQILYHPGKANVVADALIYKTMSSHFRYLCLRMGIISPLLYMIKKAQVEGLKKEIWKAEPIRGHIPLFFRDGGGLLTKLVRVWVSTTGVVRYKVLEEAHKSKFSIHRGARKMYRDLKLSYWWSCM